MNILKSVYSLVKAHRDKTENISNNRGKQIEQKPNFSTSGTILDHEQIEKHLSQQERVSKQIHSSKEIKLKKKEDYLKQYVVQCKDK